MEFPQPERDKDIYHDAVKLGQRGGKRKAQIRAQCVGWLEFHQPKLSAAGTFVPSCQHLPDNLSEKHEDFPFQ